MEQEVTLPKLGESILTAKVVQWFKQEGDHVDLDEPLLEVSTDKVNSEIPSPVKGTLTKILMQPEEECAVGTPLCLIETEAKAHTTPHTPKAAAHQEPAETNEMISPAVLRLASEAHIGLDELKRIRGTGGGGRVTKKDVEDYIASRHKPCPYQKSAETRTDIERVKMTGMRKAIAESMVRSFYQAPHASLVAEIDVTAVKRHIEESKGSFQATHGCKLTITSFIARAIASALQEFPYLNASIEEDTIVLKRHVHLGIAVSVEKGILVPVIKNCDQLSLAEIAKEVAKLSEKARQESLKPDDVQGGTITMTNFGMSGVKIGIPIIHYPEVAIIGVGAIERQVVALEDDTIGIRSRMHLSLTFDHRVIDGMYGCAFLAAVKRNLEKMD
jgi:2-oxoglutarate dehydrogenase E2 component (dihydrolipoamide succinyltransferase)